MLFHLAEDILVYIEIRRLCDYVQRNISNCDNPMSQQLKKVAGKQANRGFLAKNEDFFAKN